MSTIVTPEIEELEKQKTYFAHQMRLHDLKIKKINLENNLEQVLEEIHKMETKLASLNH